MSPAHFLLCALLVVFPEGQAQITGQSGCPCIEWKGLEKYRSRVRGELQVIVRPSGEGGSSYPYPAAYGNLVCMAWDATLPPYCRNENGTDKANVPSWCRSTWCYVDKKSCNLPLVYRSNYFPREEVYYSYATCGTKNTFSRWFQGGAETGLHAISELTKEVGHYVRATRNEIESSFLTQTSGSGCRLTSGCACEFCHMNADWGQRVDFTGTVALTSNSLFKCLGMIVSDTYKRVAGREYNNASRVGYLYMGFQEDGSYMQWPGIDFCPSSYDPRFRDWYAGPAAGPKDVVVVIDRSGSMSTAGRMALAKSAAKSVLRTLTWVDMVNVVAFSSSPAKASLSMVPATADNKQRLERWIDALSEGGSTNFIDALDMAMSLLLDGRGSRCLTTTCAGALLFLTDGTPDSWGQGDYDLLRSRNSGGYVRVFSYALGAGADHKILQRLAKEHGGEFHSIGDGDGGNLGDAMASYYKVFADRLTSADTVRWIMYEDAITHTELLAGCLPFFDRRNAKHKTLLGVTCMDINIIADLPTLRANPGWQDFKWAQETDSRSCSDEAGRVLSDSCQDEWSQAAINVLSDSWARRLSPSQPRTWMVGLLPLLSLLC
mmetsp:Transcript_111768/g.316142  ORF Transcript_111768/g.316142 Transcript_111768/m.316142 type:complete len:604 (+) Transcript_111768:41-1852(+)